MFGLDLSSVTLPELIAAAPRYEVQIVLAAIQAVTWFIAISFLPKAVEKWIGSWSAPMRKQWTKMNQATFKKTLFVDFDEEGAFEFACVFIVILSQHGVGGGLCVPAAFGFLPSIAPILARHGGLCEVGWEVQDYARRWWDILFGGPKERARQPLAIMIIVTLHHAMGTGLVVPMNVHFGENAFYHELVFLLQAAALGAMGLQQVGYTFDISKRGDLIKMKVLVLVTAAIMLYSRVFRYGYVCYQILVVLRAEGGSMFYAALTVCGCMGLLNIIFVLDALQKAAKFLPKSLPASASKPATTTTIELKEMEDLAIEALSCHTPLTPAFLTRSQKQWAKLKGLQKMGLLKQPKKDK